MWTGGRLKVNRRALDRETLLAFCNCTVNRTSRACKTIIHGAARLSAIEYTDQLCKTDVNRGRQVPQQRSINTSPLNVELACGAGARRYAAPHIEIHQQHRKAINCCQILVARPHHDPTGTAVEAKKGEPCPSGTLNHPACMSSLAPTPAHRPPGQVLR